MCQPERLTVDSGAQTAAGAVDRLTNGFAFVPVPKVELSLGDSKHNFTGYGLPALVTRSPGEG
jgi:hypothetical protein